MKSVWAISILCLSLLACDNYQDPQPGDAPAIPRETSAYGSYGGSGGRQFTASGQITPDNVDQLQPLWSYHTGDVSTGSKDIWSSTTFQNTPILADGLLYMHSV